MASFVYNKAAEELISGVLNLETVNGFKLMLIGSSPVYTPDNDHLVVDAGGANDPIDCELSTTNYTAGHGGSGRKVYGGGASTNVISFQTDNANNRAEILLADVTWTALGPASGGPTVVAAILIKPGASNDTTARLIAYFDITDTQVNGGDFTLNFDETDGAIRLTT